MIIVVGVGADGTAGISEVAKSELRSAAVIYGAPRQLALLDDTVTAPRLPWPSPMMPALRHLLDDAGGEDVHVVASGDPLLHGIGGFTDAARRLGADRSGHLRAPRREHALRRAGGGTAPSARRPAQTLL